MVVLSVTDEFNTTATLTTNLKPMSPPRSGSIVGDESRAITMMRPKILFLARRPSAGIKPMYGLGRPNVRVVVTGVAAALPGRDTQVIKPGMNNIQRIIAGENCITPISDQVKNNMLEKNVVLLKKNKETGQSTRVPITSHEDNINYCLIR